MEKVIKKIKSINNNSNICIFCIALIIILSIIINSASIKTELHIHILIELIIAIVGICVSIIVFNTYKICENNYFTFIGTAYGFISLFLLMQTMHFNSCNQTVNHINNLSILVFIFRMYLETISLLVSFTYLNKKINLKKTLIRYFIILAFIILLFIFRNNYKWLNDHNYLTIYWNISIGIVFYLNIIIFFKVLKCKKIFNNKIFKLMYNFIAFKIISSLCFFIIRMGTKYGDLFNIAAHLFKLFSYFLLYEAIIKNVLKVPLDTIFKNLKIKNEKLNNQNLELKKVKKKLKKSRENYQVLVESIPEGIILTKDSKIKYINKRILELVELEKKDLLIGKPMEYLGNILNISKTLNKINFYEKETQSFFTEKEILRKDNSKINIEIVSIPIKNNNEKYNLYIIRDITGRKRAEQIEKILEIEKLTEKIKTEFFSNLSHELKTPVNILYSIIQLNDVHIERKDIKSIKKYNKVMKKNCFRLIRLINNLIDITEIYEGFLTPKFRNYNIVNIVENTTLAVYSYIKDKNIDIIFDTEVEEKYIRCDAELIERIVLNLLSNSVKYGKERTFIKVNIYDNKDFILISVKDNGIGISKENQKNIFKPFMQEDKSLNRNREGSGIGLTIAKSLAELHGGTIYLESTLGVGTEFIVKIPVDQALEEACADIEVSNYKNIMDKVYIEFSDIYF
ncbi:Non-motile and phage-resistance protein [Clostridium acetireducens DSM 10703]|uniref:histidine kinase n=1 Tax=Clostridium acetireducens DSM 10703 TaxID=1121290 RepID=A0A1E8EZS5_9CLOT|nr:MASE3 domain-containing protein [Clostridium acetireducens]OFI06525.1 Non-motile and phage-resistance protein [Clostridium acetireducens DSM 10703]